MGKNDKKKDKEKIEIKITKRKKRYEMVIRERMKVQWMIKRKKIEEKKT